MAMQLRVASVVPSSINEDDRTVELTFTTGATVRRYNWYRDETYEEILSLEPGHVRLDRMNGGAAPVLRDHHNSIDHIVGAVQSASIGNGAGTCVVKMDSGDEQADRIWRQIKDGMIRSVSVGYRIHKIEITREEGKTPIYRAVDWEPYEVSLVAVPADAGAGVRDGGNVVPVEIIDLARGAEGKEDEGMTTPNNAPAQEQNTRSVGNAGGSSVNPAPVAGSDQMNVDQVRNEAIESERQRISEINALVDAHAGLDSEFARSHITAGTAIAEVRAAALTALGNKDAETGVRTKIEVGKSFDDPTEIRAAMVNALGHSMAPNVIKLEGMGQKFRAYTPLGFAEESLAMKGITAESRSRADIIRAAMHSTSDFPLLLADSGNMVLQKAYELASPVYREIAARKNFSDFRPHSFLTSGDFPELKKLNENGEIKSGTMSEGKEAIKIDTYARKISLTRQLLVNDSLGAFGDFPAIAGRRIAVQENSLVMAVLKANAGKGVNLSDGKPIFHTAHGNLAAAGTAIDVDALSAARAAMRKQKSKDGLPLNVTAKVILVGPDKETEAEKITASILAAATGEVNPFSGKLMVVTDAEIDGNAWYTFADPDMVDVLAYGYLNGNEAPMMAVKEGWDTDGMEFRVIHDFAAGATGSQGAYLNTGA
ncbi:hypothetical protein TH9_12230 [Thalassospira xiamenensis]|nr:hypothetical protein TH9_12230 [Thalassospira xiamenensis]